MGAFSDYFQNPANQPAGQPPSAVAPEDEGLGETFSKGLSSGLRNAGASLNQLAGLGGEAAGFNDFAKGRYATAKTLRQSAAELAPQHNSWDEVHDARSLLRFGAGELGAMAPVAGAAVGAGLATGNPFVAGTVAMGLPAAGDIAQRQQEDPQAAAQSAPIRLRNALAGGMVSGGVQNIGPGMFASKVAGKIAAPLERSVLGTIGHNMAESVGVNAAGSAAGEGISQYATNQDRPLDMQHIQDAAVTGGVMGLPFGAGGAAADLVHSRAGGVANAVSGAAKSVQERLVGAKDAAQGAVDAAPKQVASVWDGLGEMAQKGRQKLDDTVDRVMNGQPLGDLEKFAAAQGENLRSMVDLSNNETAKAATKWVSDMANDAGLTAEARQAAADALSKVGTDAGNMAAGALKKTYDMGKAMADKIGTFADAVGADVKAAKRARSNADVDEPATYNPDQIGFSAPAAAPKQTINQRKAFIDARIQAGRTPEQARKEFIDSLSDPKRSDDDSGYRQVFRESVIPAVKSILEGTPGLFDRPADVDRMGDSLRLMGEKIAKGPLDFDTIAKAIDVFGDRTVDVMAAVHRTMRELNTGASRLETERFFKNLNEIDAIQKRSAGLHDTVAASLTDAAKQSTLSSDIPSLTRMMVAHARGELGGRGAAEDMFVNTRMADMMREHFGDKADLVSNAVEKEARTVRGRGEEALMRMDDAGNEVQPSEGGFDESGRRLEAEQTDAVRKGRGPNNDPVMHPDLFASSRGPGQNYAAQYMKDMQAKYPDHDVRFEYAEGSKTHGHVVAEKAADPTSFSPADMDALKHDTKKYPNSPSRLKVGDLAIDAVKVAKVMRSKGQADWEGPNQSTNKQNLVEAFKRGIAQLTDQAGAAIHVPDGAVIGFTGGKALTWGEAKSTPARRSAQDRSADTNTELVHEYRKRIAEATWSDKKLAEHGLEHVPMNDEARRDMKQALRELEQKIGDAQAVEMTKYDGHDARAEAAEKLAASEKNEDGQRRMDKPFEEPSSEFKQDEEGGQGKRTSEGLKRDLETRGITERSKDEQIHQAAIGSGVNREPVKSNMAGGAHHVSDRLSEARNDLAMTVHEWGQAKSGPAKKIAERAKVLLEHYGSMGKADRRAFQLLAGKSPGEASGTVNALAQKYKDVIVAPGAKPEKATAAKAAPATEPGTNLMAKAVAKRQEYLNNPPADSETAQSHVAWAEKQLERVRAEAKKAEGDRVADLDGLASSLKALIDKGKQVLEGDASLKDFEGSPDPKALAAKKAALLEAASSSDPALLKELATSTDAKGLQRAVEVLPPGKALDTANARLALLVHNPDTAYGLQTKKYSLESTNAPGADDAFPNAIRRAADRLRHHFNSGDAALSAQAAQRLQGVGRVHLGGDGAAFGVAGGKGAEAAYFVAGTPQGTHAFVVAPEHAARVTSLLREQHTPQSRLDLLAHYALQHSSFELSSGKVETFGPRLGSPAAEWLEQHHVLGHTGEVAHDGSAITRMEGVAPRQTVQFLGLLAAYTKALTGHETLDANWVRSTGANIGKVGSGKFSAQATSAGTSQTINSRANVEAHIEKVLGQSVQVKWAKLTHAGEFERMRLNDVIRLSVHALDPMSVAHHESLHAFFAQLKDAGATDITQVLEKAAASPHALAQMQEFFKGEPGVLAQLKDPEERAAYMYQLWASDPKSIQLGPQVKGVFGRIADFVRGVLGIWTNDQRALHIMDYFHSGEYAQNMGMPSAVRRHLMEAGRSEVLETARSFVEPLAKLADAVMGTGSARLRDTGIPALNQLADLVKRDGTAQGGDQGFIQAARVEGTKRRGALGEALAGYTPDQLQDAMEGLQKGQKPGSKEAQAAADAIKGVLADTKSYMEKAGVEMGDLGRDYFPRVWDTHYISKHQQDFLDMLDPYVRSGQFKGDPKEFMAQLGARDGAEFGIETRTPGMQFKKERKLAFIKPADAAMFVSKDLFGTLNSYIGQATRRAEWNRRLGDGQLESLFAQAKSEGATPEHLALADQYLKGVDGTLGDGLNPTARRVMGNMIVYQNVRLLPLAMFSMLIDPMGVMVRGGTLKESWSTFQRGMAAIPESFGRATKHDEASKLAELVGVVDSAALAATMGDTYTQGMVGGTAQKINNTFFKLNMVEGLNRSFRIGASEAAMSFMGRHADGKDSVHSKRWMAELGVQKGDIKMVGKRIALTEAEGLSPEQVNRVHGAINQWVDGAMLRPDAADKPIWMNDPHYALISHLKQFVFAFQKTIIGRVTHEIEHGNYTPAMALASYVPIMMAADFAKGMIMGGGDQPEWKKGWGMSDYLGSGIQRAGLLGVGQFGYDVSTNIQRGGFGLGALAGPTLEQFADSMQLLGGHKQFGHFMLDALPANALYKESLGGESKADPMFAD